MVCRLVEIDYFFSGDRIVVGYNNFEKRMMFDIGDDRDFLYTIWGDQFYDRLMMGHRLFVFESFKISNGVLNFFFSGGNVV